MTKLIATLAFVACVVLFMDALVNLLDAGILQ